jgi:hypothetical protein
VQQFIFADGQIFCTENLADYFRIPIHQNFGCIALTFNRNVRRIWERMYRRFGDQVKADDG